VVVGVRQAFHQPERARWGTAVAALLLVAALVQCVILVCHVIWLGEVALWTFFRGGS